MLPGPTAAEFSRGTERVGFFEREAKFQFFGLSAFFIVPVVLTVLYVFACNPIEFARVDACLDRGGSFNYDRQECELDLELELKP